MNTCKLVFFTLLAHLVQLSLLAQASSVETKNIEKVYYQKINDDIFKGAWRTLKEGIEAAEAANVDFYILELNTYGGEVSVADSMRTKLLNAKMPTVVWINDNAASAGALISLACDSIYMNKTAKMGASTVVNGLTGEGAIDKYQSYMRATFRATAESQGRNPDIAEAMVDQDVVLEGIVEAGKTLTFTTVEAIKNNYCEGEINSKEALLEKLNAQNAEVIMYQATTIDYIIGWLMSPAVAGVLITMIMGGIYLELKTPGIGLGSVCALCGALLYFAPYYLEGLAANWEILIFVIGIVLLVVEIFLIPGFGVFGVAGMFLIGASLTFAMIGNDVFDFSGVAEGKLSSSLFTVLLSTLLSIVLLFVFGATLLESSLFKQLELSNTQDATQGYTVAVEKEAQLVGKIGVAITDLRIAGKIKVDNQIFDVISSGEYIEEGTEVVLDKYQGRYFVVSKKA